MSGVSTCGVCGLVFRSVAGFDMHRVGSYATLPDSKHGAQPGTRRCLTPDEMTERGMARNERNQWTTGAMPVGLHVHRADVEP